MDWDTWSPIYRAICAEFGYDPAEDRAVRDTLATALAPPALDRLSMQAETVAVVVGAGLDASGLRRVRNADSVVATADALDRLDRAAIPVRCVVTDLDSTPSAVCARTAEGGLVAVHAHGDNGDAIDAWIDRMAVEHVIGTTQAEPVPSVINTGGYTDGDRAAFLAHTLGADRLTFVGWDLDDRSVGPEKRAKLDWAARLLTWLERERGETYTMLEGHRRPLGVE